ncbi:hypothetical protein FBU30_004611 [Linnemannia zychae]|nr:hypothetical protein FBU30_004611 [Linnemannia zychae]
MSDSIGHDATPHPRDKNNHLNDSDSDSDNAPAPSFLSRPHSQQSNARSPTPTLKGTDTKTTGAASGTTPPKPREAFRPSVFGVHPSRSKSKHSKANSEDSDSGLSSNDDDDDNDGENKRGHKKKSRRRRFSDSASHLLAKAPPVPDLRFDHNYRKALDQIYETHAKETAAYEASIAAATLDEKSATGTLLVQKKPPKKVPSIAKRITVMTLRDIIITPFIHGFFWGFGAIILTLVGQRSLMYHVQRTWRKTFGGDPDTVVNTSRGQPARVRRIGGGGNGVGAGGFGLGGIGLMNAGSAKPTGYGY